MKKIVFFFCLHISFSTISAQNYGNEWIDFSKTYYKFTSDKSGLHRIEYTALLASGVNLNGANLKLYSRGVQIPIYVTTSGNLGPSDYVEFYGQKNDGYFDTQLHWYNDHQCNSDLSLFTDLIGYFLVSDASGQHLRFETITNNIAGVGAPVSYFLHESRKNTNNLHHPGEPHTNVGESSIWFADFEKGEGFVGPSVQADQPYSVLVPSTNLYTGGPSTATVNIRTVGRIHSIGAYNDQHIVIKVNNTVYVDDFSQEYNIENHQFNIPISALSTTSTGIQCEAFDGVEVATGFPYTTRYAPIFATITYPHSFDFEGKRSFVFKADISTDRYFEVTNFVGETAPIVYDLTSMKRLVPTVQNNVYKFKVPAQAGVANRHQILISNTTSTQSLTEITAGSITTRNFTNYGLVQNQGMYIIITHPDLRSGTTDWVDQYRRYRQTGVLTSTPTYAETNSKTSPVCLFNSIVIADIEELYDQFAHGIPKNPLSIKNFINYALNSQSPGQWNTAPTHCFIIGKAVKYPAFRYNPAYFPTCLVPTYGHQPSDNMLMTANIFSYQPQIAVGRLPAQTTNEVRAYLAKMIEYEQAFTDADLYCDLSHRMWMKNALFIAKGWGQSELAYLLSFGSEYAQTAQGAEAGMNIVATLTDNCDHCSFPSPNFVNYLEGGLNFINYNGHSTGLYWQFDVDEPEDYNNEGQYPFILSNSCFVGQIHETSNTSMSEQWVLSDNHGAIAYMATLFLAYPAFLDIFANAFTENLFVNYYGESIGSSIVQTIEDIYDQDSEGVKVTCLEFTYAGDPATKLYHFDHPEYIIQQNTGFQVLNSTVNLDNDNAISAQITLYNAGAVYTGNVNIQAVVSGPSGVAPFTYNTTLPSPNAVATTTINIPFPQGWSDNATDGVYTVTLTIDPQNMIVEDCNETTNNVASATFTVESATCPSNFNILNFESTYCQNSLALNLTATYPAIFTVGGVTTNVFNPTQVGSFAINATYIDPITGNQCSKVFSTTVYPVPISLFTASATEVCQGTSIVFTFNGSAEANANYNWNFGQQGDYSVVNQGNQNYMVTYFTPGTKVVSLQVSNTNGCSSTINTQYFNISPPLTAPVLSCQTSTPNSVTFSWSGVPGAEYYNLSVNGDSQLLPNINSYTISELAENQSVTLQITAANFLCGQGSVSFPITCQASGCTQTNIQFYGISHGEIFCSGSEPVSFLVSPTSTIVNGNGISGENGTYNFDPTGLTGYQTIYYSYTDAQQCNTNLAISVIVENGEVPLLSGLDLVCSGTDGVSYTVSNGVFSTYDWTVIGGVIADNNGGNIVVNWNDDLVQGQVYVATTDNNGCAGNSPVIVVNADNSQSPQASFTVGAGNQLCLGETLEIVNNSQNANSLHWIVTNTATGEEETFTATDPAFDFSTPGTYDISLTAFGCGSTQNTFTQNAAYTIFPHPIVQLLAASENACLGDTIQIQSNFDEGQFSWTGPNLLSDNAPDILAVINLEINTYTLVYTDANGCVGTSNITIFLDNSVDLIADFASNTTGVCAGESFSVQNLSTGVSYNWTVTPESTGIPTSYQGASPQITPTVSDNYLITLQALGCVGVDEFVDTISVEVFTIEDFSITTDSLSVCAGDTIILSVNNLEGDFVWSGNVLLNNTGNSVSAIVNDTASFQVIYTDSHGCIADERSITIYTKSLEECTEDPEPGPEPDPKLFPDVITPNGDNINDTWNISALVDYPANKVEIYSRWGALLYESTIPYDNSFNGIIDGKDFPSGTYYYVIYFNDGSTKPKSGPLTILK